MTSKTPSRYRFRVSLPQPLCYRCTIYAPAPHAHNLCVPSTTRARPLTTTTAAHSHPPPHPHPPQGIIIAIGGIAAAFLFIAGAPEDLRSLCTMHLFLLITGNRHLPQTP